MARQPAFTFAAIGLLLAGCSGGTIGQTGASLPNVGPDTTQTVSDAADALDVHRHSASQDAAVAIGVADAFGSRIKELSDESAVEAAASLSASREAGRCQGGAAFFQPDRAGDPNSSETLSFYDAGCRQLARDSVRIYAPRGPNGELVKSRISLYSRGTSTPLAVRSETAVLSNAAIGGNGFPLVAHGFAGSTTARLTVRGGKQVDEAGQFVVLPAQSRVNDFCAESAGYGVTGVPSLGVSFGWQGGALSGARAADGRGSVSWSATESGTIASAPIDGLSLARGSASGRCPIVTPSLALRGDATKSSFSFPVTATFQNGVLRKLVVAHAHLANGQTLRASTAVEKGGAVYVEGTIRSANLPIASFHIDAFGEGVLTITSTGAQYVITDWIVAGT